MRLKRLAYSTFFTLGLLSPLATARVPVVESTPVSGSMVEKNVPEDGIVESTLVSQTSTRSGSGTAHLLNLMDEMRQEMMTLRGQVEEQAYQIRQLQQENRDRYLDLDQRISNLRKGMTSVEASALLPAAPLETATAKKVTDKSSLKEGAAYRAAFSLIKEKRFNDALVAMKKLLVDFPEGSYSDNAQYWLGEIQMAQGNYAEAKTEFMTVVSKYPESGKVADAAYKLGRIFDLLGDKSEAKKRLESVVNKYPGTTAARLSDTYLRNM